MARQGIEARYNQTVNNGLFTRMTNPDTATAELCLQDELADNLALIKHRWAEIRYAMEDKRALELSRKQSDGSLSAEGRQREIKATLDGLGS